jgi:hypothetical protein
MPPQRGERANYTAKPTASRVTITRLPRAYQGENYVAGREPSEFVLIEVNES